MSKQLAISAAFSIFTMAAFTLISTAGNGAAAGRYARVQWTAGAPIEISAPAFLP